MVASPEQVMKLYMNKLTPYEHHEIFNYPQIYFIGANAKKRPGIIGGPNNCGYDDEQVKIINYSSEIFFQKYFKVHHDKSFNKIILFCRIETWSCIIFSVALFKVQASNYVHQNSYFRHKIASTFHAVSCRHSSKFQLLQ